MEGREVGVFDGVGGAQDTHAEDRGRHDDVEGVFTERFKMDVRKSKCFESGRRFSFSVGRIQGTKNEGMS